jgi:integrase
MNNELMNKESRRPRPRTREHLTPEEVAKFLAAAKDKSLSRNPERDYCLLLLMVRHGLRVSEACSLKLSDVDMQSKVMHVKRLKNGKSTTHPLYNGEVKAIRDWMVKRQGDEPGRVDTGRRQHLVYLGASLTAISERRLQDGQHLCRGCGTLGAERSPSHVAPRLRVRSGEPRS